MVINNKFNLEDYVYLKTDPEQLERMVTKIDITKGDIMYQLCSGLNYSTHYEFEITEEKRII